MAGVAIGWPVAYSNLAPCEGGCARALVAPSPAEIGHSPLAYNMVMVEIRQTEVYARWFGRLRDRQARVRVDSRIRRLSLGNPGDVRPVGEGVSEIRIDYGPGYRVYFVQRGEALVVLLARGDKDSQERDIRRALELARGL